MKVQLGTQVDAELRRQLRVYAARTGLKLQDVVTHALESYLSAGPAEAAAQDAREALVPEAGGNWLPGGIETARAGGGHQDGPRAVPAPAGGGAAGGRAARLTGGRS